VHVPQQTSGSGLIESITAYRHYDGSISTVIEGRLGPETAKKSFERDVPRQGHGTDRAHLWGHRFGDEAVAGIKESTIQFNRSLQQRVENTIVNYKDGALKAGLQPRLRATVVTDAANSSLVDHVVYEVWLETSHGEFVDGWTVTIERDGHIDTELSRDLTQRPRLGDR
jgi:hypothetical protein